MNHTVQVTYLGHSGFLVELDSVCLLFDCIAAQSMTPALAAQPCSFGIMPRLDPHKELFIFVSHAHQDHYSPRIWDLARRYPKALYILSDDVPAYDAIRSGAVSAEAFSEKIRLVGPNIVTSLDLEGGGTMQIETLFSNDAGVAFYLNLPQGAIFHSGDLNRWIWDGDEEDMRLDRTFYEQLSIIRGRRIDIAFLPLDPRLKENGWLGADAYLKAADIRYAFPMHFWKQYDYVRTYIESADALPQRARMIPIRHENEVFTLEL